MKLIESIYRNYYVPPIIFTVMKEGNLNMRRCVDGKQRLTSIQKFIDGQVCGLLSVARSLTPSCFRFHVGLIYIIPRHLQTGADKDPITKKMYWFVVSTAQATKHRLEVPQYWKKLFLDKQLTCGMYAVRRLFSYSHMWTMHS